MSQDFQFESFKMSRNATATTVKYTDNKDILMNFVFIEFLVEWVYWARSVAVWLMHWIYVPSIFHFSYFWRKFWDNLLKSCCNYFRFGRNQFFEYYSPFAVWKIFIIKVAAWNWWHFPRWWQNKDSSSSFMLLMPNANRLNPTQRCFSCQQFFIIRHQNRFCQHNWKQKSEIKNDLLYKISIKFLFSRTFLSSLGDYLFNFS